MTPIPSDKSLIIKDIIKPERLDNINNTILLNNLNNIDIYYKIL